MRAGGKNGQKRRGDARSVFVEKHMLDIESVGEHGKFSAIPKYQAEITDQLILIEPVFTEIDNQPTEGHLVALAPINNGATAENGSAIIGNEKIVISNDLLSI
jgi:hypothetical protein